VTQINFSSSLALCRDIFVSDRVAGVNKRAQARIISATAAGESRF
jgi:hypothetical protein